MDLSASLRSSKLKLQEKQPSKKIKVLKSFGKSFPEAFFHAIVYGRLLLLSLEVSSLWKFKN